VNTAGCDGITYWPGQCFLRHGTTLNQCANSNGWRSAKLDRGALSGYETLSFNSLDSVDGLLSARAASIILNALALVGILSTLYFMASKLLGNSKFQKITVELEEM